MLVRFAVKNYRGFSQRLEWNLSNPSNYEYNNYAIKDGVIKNGIVYGPNGSGKTNLGMALFDIVNHLTQKFKKAGYYNNFVYAGLPNGRRVRCRQRCRNLLQPWCQLQLRCTSQRTYKRLGGLELEELELCQDSDACAFALQLMKQPFRWIQM